MLVAGAILLCRKEDCFIQRESERETKQNRILGKVHADSPQPRKQDKMVSLTSDRVSHSNVLSFQSEFDLRKFLEV